MAKNRPEKSPRSAVPRKLGLEPLTSVVVEEVLGLIQDAGGKMGLFLDLAFGPGFVRFELEGQPGGKLEQPGKAMAMAMLVVPVTDNPPFQQILLTSLTS